MTTSKKELSAFEQLELKVGRLTFGAMLRSWRIWNEHSQTDFAKKLAISVQNLNDLEKGRKIPTPLRAAKIAKKLKLPEIALVQLALRDSLAQDGLNYTLTLESA